MRILILGGGSGDVGRDVTRILLKHAESIDKITVTARKLETANDFIKELNDNRAFAARLDVTDAQQLKELMQKHDLIVNTVGPFSRYTVPIIKAAIETKVNYIDICDDIEPTIEAKMLDKSAKDAGVFVLLSMGWFPGMSNLRAKALADQMDKVDEIVTAWAAGKKAAEEKPSLGIGGIEHYLLAITGNITTYRNGKKTKISANQKGVKIPFPEPLGSYICYQMEHPEPITLPWAISGVRTASNLGSLYPDSRNKIVRFIARLIDFKIFSIPLATKFFIITGQKGKGNLPVMNGTYVACIGTKDGKKGQLYYSATNTSVTTAEATSQPLACAILNIVSGAKIKPGVHLPETAIDINDIITSGARYKLPFVTDAKEITSWSEKIISLEN
jgi:saccharopine dehydrogenase-like NADP-dependent oxidoreductase